MRVHDVKLNGLSSKQCLHRQDTFRYMNKFSVSFVGTRMTLLEAPDPNKPRPSKDGERPPPLPKCTLSLLELKNILLCLQDFIIITDDLRCISFLL